MSSFRVFISSTFKNFEYERNYLEQHLYALLNDSCRRRGHAFHAIDLRWGISSEASLDNKSMLLCLEEIKKCQSTNIKPNFLIMLGDYYGWKPLPFVIEEQEAQKIIPALDSQAVELFQKCYKLDTNSIPYEYVLQGRQGEFVNKTAWELIETQLHDALENAAKMTLPEDRIGKYTYSATHQEIIQGFLKEEIIKDYTFVFIKEEGNIHGNEIDYHNARKLKEAVVALLPEEQYVVFQNDEDFPSAVKKAEAFLKHTIDMQIELLTVSNQQAALVEGLLDNYIPYEKFEEEIIQSIGHLKGKKIIIAADRHEGKTSLLSSVYYRLKTINSQNVYLWCANSGYEHLSIIDLCRFIILICTDGTKKPYIDYDNACYFVQKVLSAQEDDASKTVFLIDGIEDLADYNKVYDMFHNIVLPNNIVFVLTMSAKNTMQGDLQLVIPPFENEKKELLFGALLADCNRSITDEQRAALMPIVYTGNPLLVRFLANKAKKLHSYDVIDGKMDSIHALVENEIQYLSTPTMYGDILVSRIMLFLAFSPYGISETELLDLLKLDADVVNYLKTNANWEFDEQISIPKVVLYRIMSDVRAYVMELNIMGNIIYRFNSQNLSDVVFEIYDSEIRNRLYEQYKEYITKRRVYINAKKNIDERIARQWHYLASKENSELVLGLNSVGFCDACIKLGEIHFLIDGFKRMNLSESSLYTTILKYYEQLIVFPDMFLTYLVAENIIQKNDYRKYIVEQSGEVIQRITNWMNDKLEFCHILSEEKYIIACENSLIMIDRGSNREIDKITFNAQIWKCCLSDESRVLLVACANTGEENSVLYLYLVDIENWSVINQIKPSPLLQGRLNKPNFQIVSHDKNFIVMASCCTSTSFSDQCHIYYVNGETCEAICSMNSLCTGILISSKYLLIKNYFDEIRLFDLEQRQFVFIKKSIKYVQLDLEYSVLAADGNTYCVVGENGVFRLWVEDGEVKVRKVFSFVPTTKLNHSALLLLKNGFLLKQGGSEYSDIYTYDGMYAGKCEWDGSTYVLDYLGDRIRCVDIGGKLFDKAVDTSITFDQKKVHISPIETWRTLVKSLMRISNSYKKYYKPQNSKKICVISPNGKYTACLTKDSLVIFRDGQAIFEYFYKSNHVDQRDIFFVENHIVLWKQSHKRFISINIEKKMVKTVVASTKKMFGYVMVDNSLYISRSTSIKWRRQTSDIIKDAVTRVQITKSGEATIENLKMDIKFSEPLEIIKALRKSLEAKIVFSYRVPSQLQFNALENDQIICLSNEYAVRCLNNVLFFYSYCGNEQLITAYAFYKNNKPDKSKISVYQDILYCYLEPLKMVLMYNKTAKQTISYLLDDAVCDVVFDKNTVRALRINGSIDTINIV